MGENSLPLPAAGDAKTSARSNALSDETIKEGPPSYDAALQDVPPDLVAAFANASITDDLNNDLTAEKCIAHLKLLEAISELREDIGNKNGLFGLRDEYVQSAYKLSEADKRKNLCQMREKRWAIYLVKAAARFEKWYKSIENDPQPVTIDLMSTKEYSRIHENATAYRFFENNLPPLDVLMVWHTFLLSPRNFLSDCIRHSRLRLWKAGLPLRAIAACIDNNSFNYAPGKIAQVHFTEKTGLPWDILDGPQAINIACASCSGVFEPQLTTTDFDDLWIMQDQSFQGHGLADADFLAPCDHCGTLNTHEALRAYRFREDAKLLLNQGVPLPGTLLDSAGLPNPTTLPLFFNRLLQVNPELKRLIKQPDLTSIDNVRRVLGSTIRDTEFMKTVCMSSRGPEKDERASVRRVLSAYWDNASIFSIDLVGAVRRQNLFTQKMHRIDWLHSPALRGTMDRLIEKYLRFINMMRKLPKQVFVPTLDVDLAWHTHQLRPAGYLAFGVQNCKKLINHDDKIDENTLSLSFEQTSEWYELFYKRLYAECTCWYCEATREAHRPMLGSIAIHSNVKAELSELQGAAANPHDAVHVSTHNAIHPKENPHHATAKYVRRQRLERSYQKAVQRANKQNREPPARETDKYYPYWGYDYPVVCMPYMADPCISSDLYPANPLCASYGTLAPGNCTAGTCGGPVTSGDCGGGCSSGGGGDCGGGDGGGCGGGD